MNRRYIHTLLLTFLALSYGLRVQAQQVDSVRRIDEVMVTATHSSRSIKNLPVITQVIRAKDIERISPRTVSDILEMTIPGVEISQNGGQTVMKIQGYSSDYFLLLIDGEKITGEGNGAVDLNRINISSIERVEVIRGAATAIYGSNAIAGVVNFITKKASEVRRIDQVLEYGTDGQKHYGLSAGLNLSKTLSSLTTYGRRDQSEYRLPNAPESVGIVPGSETLNLGQKLRWRTPDNRWGAYLSGLYSLRKQHMTRTQDYQYDVVNATATTTYSPDIAHSFALSYNFESYDRRISWVNVPNEYKEPLYHLITHNARLLYNFGDEQKHQFNVTTGAEFLWEGVKGDRLLSNETRFHAHTLSLFAQADYRPSSIVTLSAGLREDIHSRFGGHLTSRFALLYRPFSQVRLRFSYAEGFRSPSLKNMYMYWDHMGMFDIIGSTDLKPETSRMFSIAPEFDLGTANITLIASHNRVKDLITFRNETINERQRYIYDNLGGHNSIWSLQSNVRWHITKGLRLSCDYTWLHEPKTAQLEDGTKVQTSSARPHNLTVSLSYDRTQGDLAYSAVAMSRYSSSVYTASTNGVSLEPVYLPAYSITRVSASVAWQQYLRLTLGIDNLFDYRTKTVNFTGSLSPGRTFFSTLSITL